jgi:transposase
VRAPAFLTLAFARGECAQVDWGCTGSIAIGSTRRRLSFFVMVLCYSRLCYVEFTLGEATEHFLAAHQNALQFLGGVPAKILIDNLKTAAVHHPIGERPLFHPRYLDFAAQPGAKRYSETDVTAEPLSVSPLLALSQAFAFRPRIAGKLLCLHSSAPK